MTFTRVFLSSILLAALALADCGDSVMERADGGAGHIDGRNSANADASGDTDPNACGFRILYSGPIPIVEAFPVEAGIVVVREDGISLMNRDGTTASTWPWPRAITAATFDGERFAIADQALLTVLDPSLVELGHTYLSESCAGAVAIPGARFVCGPNLDWDRVFYTYDLLTPVLLDSSSQYTYDGIPMQGIPGRPFFITFGVSSNVALFRVGDDNVATEIRTALDDSFDLTKPLFPFGFSGNPASLMVDRRGAVFSIHSDCQPSCFVREYGWPSTFANYGNFVDGPDGIVFFSDMGISTEADIATGSTLSSYSAPAGAIARLVTGHDDSWCQSLVSIFSQGSGPGAEYTLATIPYVPPAGSARQ
jgi:hypothetical protein